MSTKTAPGRLRMKCMIWEPHPLVDRIAVDTQFEYTNIDPSIINFNHENIEFNKDGINLVPKYVFYDTFLFNYSVMPEKNPQADADLLLDDGLVIPETGPTLPEWIKSFNAEPLFTIESREQKTFYIPNRGDRPQPWIWHQTFYPMKEGLFNSKEITKPVWQYGQLQTGFNAYDEQTEFFKQIINLSDISYTTDETGGLFDRVVSAVRKTVTQAVRSQQDIAYIINRMNWRVHPMQIATLARKNCEEFPVAVATSNPVSPSLSFTAQKPVHWMVRKLTPMFTGEDFVVNFTRLSDKPDDVSFFGDNGSIKMNKMFEPLDAESRTRVTSNKLSEKQLNLISEKLITVPINSGVIDTDFDGTVKKDGFNLNLRKQAYYAIEINATDTTHNYWIIIPYNSKPVFIKISQDPVAVKGDIDHTPLLLIPKIPVSRKISTYEIIGKALMDQKTLSITVQNHFGKIKITFSGHEDKPWIIEDKIFNVDHWSSTTAKKQGEIISTFNFMYIKNLPISIAAGNIPCAFHFSPLHYEKNGYIEPSTPIQVPGPVTDSDINLLLHSKQWTNLPVATKDKKPGKPKFVNYYHQDADLLVEIVNGIPKIISRMNTLSPKERYKIRGLSAGNNFRSFFKLTNSPSFPTTEEPSTIQLTHTPLQNTVLQSNDSFTTKYQFKIFNTRLQLNAGSVTVSPLDEKKKWTIPYCLTPLSTGWRLYVPPNNTNNPICPVDVAHHVIHCTISTGYTDNTKVEKSGILRFIINPGQMTGVDHRNTEVNVDSDDCHSYNNNNIDRSVMLSELSGKTFPVRLYAWWEGGFMECTNSDCPCKNGVQPQLGGDPHVLFTGLCHGGQITVENGKRYMDCQLLDYWKYLQDGMFLNAPIYDGVRDFNAIKEILDLAGFEDGSIKGSNRKDKWHPGEYIKQIADHPSNDSFETPSVGGEVFRVKAYSLPTSYDTYQEPRYKPAEGSSLENTILQFAKLRGYMAYFDRYGIFRYVPRADIRACIMPNIKCHFYASQTDKTRNGIKLGTGCNNYDSLAIGPYIYSKKVSDVFNVIHLMTTTPEGSILTASKTNFRGKFDYTSEGYMGYTKKYFQADGIFGSQEALEGQVNFLTSLFKPPITITWAGFGTANINAGDLVKFTGLAIDNSFPSFKEYYGFKTWSSTMGLYLTSTNMDINPEKNEWINTYEGEWLFIDCGYINSQ